MKNRKFLIEVDDKGNYSLCEITFHSNLGRTIPDDVVYTLTELDCGQATVLHRGGDPFPRPLKAAMWGAHSALEEHIDEMTD